MNQRKRYFNCRFKFDKSVKNLKGKRPIINQLDRANILSSLNVVDYVVIFDEKTLKYYQIN